MDAPYPFPTSPSVSRVMRANRKADTRPELRLRSALHRAGLRFRVGLRLAAGGFPVRPDVVFTKARVAVFVDGCFWHSCPAHGTSPARNTAYWLPKLQRNVARDAAADFALRAAGWTVVRVWEHEEPAMAAAGIAVFVRRSS